MADMLEDSRKIRLLDWLTTPPAERKPDSMNKLAAELDVTSRSLRNWRAEPAFRAAWEKQAKDIVGDPEKVQLLLLSLYNGAMDGNETLASRVRAADVFLKAVDAIRPAAVDLAAKRAAELSDAELEAMWAEAAQRELALRQQATTA